MLQYVSLQSYAKIARVTALYRLTTGQQKGINMLSIYCSISKMQCKGECYRKCEVQTCKSLTPNAEDKTDQH